MIQYKKLINQARFLLLALGIICSSTPLLQAQTFDYDKDFVITVSADKAEVKPGDSGNIRFEILAPPGYSLNADPGVFSVTQLNSTDAIELGTLQKPEPDKKGYFPMMTSLSLPFSVSSSAAPGPQQLVFGFKLQVCVDASGQCLMPSSPEKLTRTATITIVEKQSAAPELGEPVQLTSEDGTPLEVGSRGYPAPLYHDFNGDAIPDLIAGEYQDGQCRIYINHGSGEQPLWRDYHLFEAGGDVAIVPPS